MKKAFVRAFAAFVVIILVITFSHMLNYALVDDAASYTRLMEHEFYNQENIDILCLGASHCYRGIIPSVVSERTGKNVFNASSSSQSPDASYALIKEAVKRYDVKEVYLEISASSAQGMGDFDDRTDLTSTYIISDYMMPSLNRAQLLLGASRSEYYVNGFFPARRKWNSILDFQYIASVLKKKNTDVYRNFGYDNAKSENEWYVGNGYVACKLLIDEHRYYTTNGFNRIDIENISDDWKNTIDAIIRYCNKNNVKLTLYDSPISCFQLASKGNYDDYISFVREFVKGKDVEYAEFNLLKEDYLPYKQTNYKDGHHLNMYGANDFSEFFSKYINGEIPEDAFYESVDEKLGSISPDFYGISYQDESENDTRTIQLVSNRPNYYEYKVEILRSDGGTDILQNYSTNNEITFPKSALVDNDSDFNRKIVVSCRIKETGEEVMILEY